MNIICFDLEGVLVPEIWIGVAEKTGITELRATTRDIPDYDELMQFRLQLTDKFDLRIADIQAVIANLEPFNGARDLLDELRQQSQLVILSDTYYEFADPLIEQLGRPTIFCHHLLVNDDGRITGYRLRQDDQKRKAVKAFRDLNFEVTAIGDSFNDTGMLDEADKGIFFCPPKNVSMQFPQYPITSNYAELRTELKVGIQSA